MERGRRRQNRGAKETCALFDRATELFKKSIANMERDNKNFNDKIREYEAKKQEIDTTTEEGKEKLRTINLVIASYSDAVKQNKDVIGNIERKIKNWEQRSTEIGTTIE